MPNDEVSLFDDGTVVLVSADDLPDPHLAEPVGPPPGELAPSDPIDNVDCVDLEVEAAVIEGEEPAIATIEPEPQEPRSVERPERPLATVAWIHGASAGAAVFLCLLLLRSYGHNRQLAEDVARLDAAAAAAEAQLHDNAEAERVHLGEVARLAAALHTAEADAATLRKQLAATATAMTTTNKASTACMRELIGLKKTARAVLRDGAANATAMKAAHGIEVEIFRRTVRSLKRVVVAVVRDADANATMQESACSVTTTALQRKVRSLKQVVETVARHSAANATMNEAAGSTNAMALRRNVRSLQQAVGIVVRDAATNASVEAMLCTTKATGPRRNVRSLERTVVAMVRDAAANDTMSTAACSLKVTALRRNVKLLDQDTLTVVRDAARNVSAATCPAITATLTADRPFNAHEPDPNETVSEQANWQLAVRYGDPILSRRIMQAQPPRPVRLGRFGRRTQLAPQYVNPIQVGPLSHIFTDNSGSGAAKNTRDGWIDRFWVVNVTDPTKYSPPCTTDFVIDVSTLQPVGTSRCASVCFKAALAGAKMSKQDCVRRRNRWCRQRADRCKRDCRKLASTARSSAVAIVSGNVGPSALAPFRAGF